MPVGIREVCGRCIDEKNLFEEGLYGFYYKDRLRDAIHAFKFSGRKDVGRYLVRLAEKKIAAFSAKFDSIIPLPVTEKRLRERGFNQSFILAEEISRMTGKPVHHSTLRKIKETKDQYAPQKTREGKTSEEHFLLPILSTSREKGCFLSMISIQPVKPHEEPPVSFTGEKLQASCSLLSHEHHERKLLSIIGCLVLIMVLAVFALLLNLSTIGPYVVKKITGGEVAVNKFDYSLDGGRLVFKLSDLSMKGNLQGTVKDSMFLQISQVGPLEEHHYCRF